MPNDYVTPGESWAAEEEGGAQGTPAAAETPTPQAETPQVVEPAPTLAQSGDEWARVRDEAAPAAETVDDKTELEAGERVASAAELQQYIKATIAGKEVEVPENLMIPLTRKGKTEYVPLKQVMAEGMMEKDYRFKTQETARERQELQQLRSQIAADQARAAEKARFLAQEVQEWQEAKRDPAKLQQWEEHYKQMRSNPLYAKAWNDAQTAREVQAENVALRSQQEERIAEDTTQQLVTAITEMGANYPGVNPQRIMQQYGQILKAGEVESISLDHVHQLYQREAANVLATVQPVQQQVEALTQELAALRAAQTAVASNANTDKAIQRAKAPNLAPVGQPQSHSKPPQKPYTTADAEEVRRKWARGE